MISAKSEAVRIHIVDFIEQASASTEQTAASSEEVLASVETQSNLFKSVNDTSTELFHLMNDLQQLVNRFKV